MCENQIERHPVNNIVHDYMEEVTGHWRTESSGQLYGRDMQTVSIIDPEVLMNEERIIGTVTTGDISGWN